MENGSKEYVKKISASFQDKIKLNCNIKAKNVAGKILLTDDKNNDYQFDQVIFATHLDQTNNIIQDKTIAEQEYYHK